MKIGIDKLLHFETCALITVAVAAVLPWWAGVITAALAGIAKELWDIKHGDPSWADLLADALGIAAGILICLV